MTARSVVRPLSSLPPTQILAALGFERRQPSVNNARSVVRQLVEAYWAAFSDISLRPLDAFLHEDLPQGGLTDQAARSLGVRLAETSPLDAGFVIGRLYTSLLPTRYRSTYGIYFTPPTLVRRLLDLARGSGVRLASATVLDPACGGGAFLAPVVSGKLAELRDVSPSSAVAAIAGSVKGYEIDPFSAWLSQIFVDAAIERTCQLAEVEMPLVVEVRDSLLTPVSDRFDLVVGNPPYGKVTLSAESRKHFARSLYGHANAYGLFMDLALRVTQSQGTIAFVTPTSFLAGQYFKSLRALLASEAQPYAFEFVSDRAGVFDDVLQETMLAVFRKSAVPSFAKVSSLRIQQDGDIEITEVGEVSLPPAVEEPWIVSRDPQTSALASAAMKSSTRLADLGYKVSTGPLVWNRHKPQLRSEPGPMTYPLIWAESVTSEGTFSFRAVKRNHEPYFEVRPGLDDHLLVRVPCVLVQRTTSKEQRRRLMAAELPAGFIDEHSAVIVENHLNIVYADRKPLVPPSVVASLLNSSVIDALFRCISGSVAVSAFELASMPLPPLETLLRYARAVQADSHSAVAEQVLMSGYSDRPTATY